MKAHTHSSQRSSHGFTLIELLTVIAIIAILMGLLFPAISSAIQQARRNEAGVALKTIVSSCNAYLSDYGKYPPIAAAEDGADGNTYLSFGERDAKCKVDNDKLFNILRAIDDGGDNAGHKLNRRQTQYINTRKATDTKNPRNGFVDGEDMPQAQKGRYLDPWGKQYCIVLDNDADGQIGMQAFFEDLSDDKNPVRQSAVGFSMSKDGKRGGSGYENRLRKPSSSEAPDDVISW